MVYACIYLPSPIYCQYIVSLDFFKILELLIFLTTFRPALSVSSHLMYLYLLPIGAAVKPWSLVSESNTVLVLGSCSVYYFADRTMFIRVVAPTTAAAARERETPMDEMIGQETARSSGLICSCSPLPHVVWTQESFDHLPLGHSPVNPFLPPVPLLPRFAGPESKVQIVTGQQQLRSMTWQLAHSDYDDSPSG